MLVFCTKCILWLFFGLGIHICCLIILTKIMFSTVSDMTTFSLSSWCLWLHYGTHMLINIKKWLSCAVDAMDLPLLNPYLDSVGAPIFQRGCNFAAAGSTILPATPPSVSPFSFGIQVAQFSRFKARVLQLQAKGKSIFSTLETISYPWFMINFSTF